MVVRFYIGFFLGLALPIFLVGAQEMTSQNYEISQGSFGGIGAVNDSSANYSLSGLGGEVLTGAHSSQNYSLRAGSAPLLGANAVSNTTNTTNNTNSSGGGSSYLTVPSTVIRSVLPLVRNVPRLLTFHFSPLDSTRKIFKSGLDNVVSLFTPTVSSSTTNINETKLAPLNWIEYVRARIWWWLILLFLILCWWYLRRSRIRP